MVSQALAQISVIRVNSSETVRDADVLAMEEPLEIRLDYGPEGARKTKSIAVTMRTPGDDANLASGFLFTEGIIYRQTDITGCYPAACGAQKENTLTVSLRPEVRVDLERLERHFYTSSSCGVCGKSSIAAVRTYVGKDTDDDGLEVDAWILHRLPEILRRAQQVFEATGGLHAAALFDRNGQLLYLKEDVGRHNAVDKLMGHALKDGQLPLKGRILLLSGRASFELIQKAAAGGIKIVAAVGAPSSLAVQLATDCNITLLGFLRNHRFNIYSGAHRIVV